MYQNPPPEWEEYVRTNSDDDEKWLGYTVTTRDGAGNGAFVRALASGTVTPLLTGQATYRGMTFDRKGTQVALISDVGDSTPKPKMAVYHASLVPVKGKPVAARKIVAHVLVAKVRDGWRVAGLNNRDHDMEPVSAANLVGVVIAAFQPLPAARVQLAALHR